jgi:hypothetical protein
MNQEAMVKEFSEVLEMPEETVAQAWLVCEWLHRTQCNGGRPFTTEQVFSDIGAKEGLTLEITDQILEAIARGFGRLAQLA